MIDDKLIFEVVSARGGGRGIKLVNLQPILSILMIPY